MSVFGSRLLFPKRKAVRVLVVSWSIAAGSLLIEPSSVSVAASHAGEQPPVSAEVPEPAALALFGIGLIAAAQRLRRRIVRVDAATGAAAAAGPQPSDVDPRTPGRDVQVSARIERNRAPL
jgi:hypothetical protein